jgi:hypothetical protein
MPSRCGGEAGRHGDRDEEAAMNWLWWVLGCGGLVVLAVAALAVLAVIDRRKTRRVLEEGDHTTGWLVQANSSLFEKGMMDLPALVLLSPDRKTARDGEFLGALAERIMDLKGAVPDELEDEDEAFVAALMSDEAYVEGKRDRLPKRFSEGREVYLAHIWVSRDHLPDKRIEGPWLPCAVIWDDPKSLVCTRPEEEEDE